MQRDNFATNEAKYWDIEQPFSAMHRGAWSDQWPYKQPPNERHQGAHLVQWPRKQPWQFTQAYLSASLANCSTLPLTRSCVSSSGATDTAALRI
jgi:hypothetical protein